MCSQRVIMNRLLAVSSMVTSSLSAVVSATTVKGSVAAAGGGSLPPMKVSSCDQMRRCDKDATDK